MKRQRIPDLISEIKDEFNIIGILVSDIKETSNELPKSQKKKRIYEESLALKLHNFYTGCERIFQKIADDINGGVPHSIDWHKRLLKSMSLEIEKIRPSVISKETAKALEEYLAFRHVVRNIYGFEIDSERLHRLIEKLDGTYKMMKKEIDAFVDFLRELSE
ncbi:hypothetical protein JZK55_12680 [Dissulfurispira thermophila]|uniref:HepT-like domain-containing protein n=1 Tax=Dissulfurispira thermophila TaxID=2715679 RepID=A0A7G1H323_9BACT|nr:hypothetical protein [Dissulfurispira thermophila]BCB96346.1 hypothetical protein JZK55_12680 [Dissulfurispira thermophila]